MKLNINDQIRFLLFLIPLCLCALACSTTKYYKYHGDAVVEGKGGTVRHVKGIDFWENGEPNRKYKVIGIIEDKRGSGFISRRGKDSNIARLAAENYEDAVILFDIDSELSGVNPKSCAASYEKYSKYLVIQYIE